MTKKDYLLLAVIALVLHILFLIILPDNALRNESDDFLYFYSPVAENLLEGKGYVDEAGAPATLYPPGFPIVLAGFYAVADLLHVPRAFSLRFMAAVCVAGSTLLIAGAGSISFSRRIGFLAGLAWAAYPVQLWASKQPNSELPFFVIFFALVNLLLLELKRQRPRWWSAPVVGILAGFGMLIRPIAIGLDLVLIVAICFAARRWSWKWKLIYSGLLMFACLAAIAPWEIWAHSQTGRWILLSTNGAASMMDGLTVGVTPSPAGLLLPLPEGARSIMQNIYEHQEELKTPGALMSFTAGQMISHPIGGLQLILLKAARAWYGTDSLRYERPLALIQCIYLCAAAYGAWAAAGMGLKARRFLVVTLFLILYFWGMTILALSILRYMTPVMGLLMVFAGVAVNRVMQRLNL